MRILQLCPRIPYPLHDGGALSIFNITKYLALRGHDIRMLALSSQVQPIPSELEKHCRASLVHAPTGHSPVTVVRSLMHRAPYVIFKYHHRRFYEAIESHVKNFQPDIVHADHLAMAEYALHIKQRYRIPAVLREHNFETVFLERFWEHETNRLLKLYIRHEYRRMSRYEPETCEKFDRCIMISGEDERRLKELSPRANTCTIPAGVELPSLRQPNPGMDGSILFLASLDWKPNLEGFCWFYREVFPLVVREFQSASVKIVGRGSAPALASMRDPSVAFIGHVDEVGPYLEEAAVCIIPLFAGSGIRIKLLEMLAYGKAVVSTSIGAEGIEVENGHNIMLGDTPEEFARAILILLRDVPLRRTIQRNAEILVREKHSWPAIAQQIEMVYIDACGS
jgi:polysaccharide biosynthesis protein PslH